MRDHGHDCSTTPGLASIVGSERGAFRAVTARRGTKRRIGAFSEHLPVSAVQDRRVESAGGAEPVTAGRATRLNSPAERESVARARDSAAWGCHRLLQSRRTPRGAVSARRVPGAGTRRRQGARRGHGGGTAGAGARRRQGARRRHGGGTAGAGARRRRCRASAGPGAGPGPGQCRASAGPGAGLGAGAAAWPVAGQCRPGAGPGQGQCRHPLPGLNRQSRQSLPFACVSASSNVYGSK